MVKMEFTPAQLDAIYAHGGSITVSAAAGSGKTRVLVERVIQMLLDENSPFSLNKLLMVTFTKSAAAEMKNRISTALEQALENIKKNPQKEHLYRRLQEQLNLLPNADICTIDSFCSRLIKENFYQLDVNRDFRIGSAQELKVLENRVMSELIEEKYLSNDEGFLLLSKLLGGKKDDSTLPLALLELYRTVSSHPFVEDWLDEACSLYNPEVPLGKSVFAPYALRILDSFFELSDYLLSEAREVIDGNEEFRGKGKSSAATIYGMLMEFLENLKEARKENNWNKLSKMVMSYPTYRYYAPKETGEEELRIVKNCFDTMKNTVKNKLQPLFWVDGEIYSHDTAQMYPAVVCLCDFLKEFDKRYLQAKKEKGMLEFSDLEHLVIHLLWTKENGQWVKTPFAMEIADKYDAIMVDEYQDTNDIQEYIFKAVSKNEENLFVVGDIKQSIYRFRESNPEIFKRRRKQSALYDRSNPQFPAKIIFDRNFRSCEGIIDSVNFVFGSVMSERNGEIEYNEDERLTVGSTAYPSKSEPSMEIHIVEQDFKSDKVEPKQEREARSIANLIQQKIQDGETITENGESRVVKYSDFAILMRYTSANAQTYCNILNENGIPAYTETEYSLFDCYEVNVALSFMKIVDNPLQDIPMLSVLMSPVFGFTADELVMIKMNMPNSSYLYGKLIAYSQLEKEGDAQLKKRCTDFIEQLSYFRKLSYSLSVDKWLNTFFEYTSYVAIMSSMTNGKVRVQNIHRLMDMVREYEKNTHSGFSGFVRYIHHLEDNKISITAKDSEPIDAVRVMTIHKSKGLEFPICILAGLDSSGRNSSPEILTHSELGFGLKYWDSESGVKTNTLQRNIIGYVTKNEQQSEEMRILYVALTRAKEKLIPIITFNAKTSYQSKLESLALKLNVEDGKISPFSVETAANFTDLLLMCALVHPDMEQLRADCGVPGIRKIPTKSHWSLTHEFLLAQSESESKESEEIQRAEPNQAWIDFLNGRFAKKYQYANRVGVPTKVSASVLTHEDTTKYHVAQSRPGFMQDSNMTGAERGTAMHLFLEKVDFAKLGSDFESEKQRLLANGFLNEAQVQSLTDEDIVAFTQSETYRHIMSADKVLREYQFTVNIHAQEVDEEFQCADDVILQGAMDCVLLDKDGVTVIDYKTDRVKSVDDLALRYSRQLHLYQLAAEQVFEMPVKKCIIYSLHCQSEVEV